MAFGIFRVVQPSAQFVAEHFHHPPPKKLPSFSSLSLFSLQYLPLQHEATSIPPSVSADLPLLDISHKWDHTTCGLSWLALSPVTYIIFKLYPRGILFIGEHLSTVRIYHIGFIHPPMSLWVVCLLWILLQWRFTYTVFSVDPRFSFHWSDMQKWNGWAIR